MAYKFRKIKDDKWEDQADRYEKDLEKKINELNENNTLKDVCMIHCDIDVFSDVYKDAYGFRPREKCSQLRKLLMEKCPEQFKEEYNNMNYEQIESLAYSKIQDSLVVNEEMIKEDLQNALNDYANNRNLDFDANDYITRQELEELAAYAEAHPEETNDLEVEEEYDTAKEFLDNTSIKVEKKNDTSFLATIGAEVGYDELEYICNVLDKAIAKYDKNAYFEPVDSGLAEAHINIDRHIQDSKQVNQAIDGFVTQIENSLKGAYSIASQLIKQIPNQQPTTNQEKELYNGKYINTFESMCKDLEHYVKFIEDYKSKLANAHVVIEEIIESFPLEARTKLRESENPEQTYKELLEDLENRFNSLNDKDKYKEQVEKMKKDLDEFYKNTFKK